jgi:hypothetical protein
MYSNLNSLEAQHHHHMQAASTTTTAAAAAATHATTTTRAFVTTAIHQQQVPPTPYVTCTFQRSLNKHHANDSYATIAHPPTSRHLKASRPSCTQSFSVPQTHLSRRHSPPSSSRHPPSSQPATRPTTATGFAIHPTHDDSNRPRQCNTCHQGNKCNNNDCSNSSSITTTCHQVNHLSSIKTSAIESSCLGTTSHARLIHNSSNHSNSSSSSHNSTILLLPATRTVHSSSSHLMGGSSSSSSAANRAQTEREQKKAKERFPMFTRVLMKYFENKDPNTHARAKQVIGQCAEKNKKKEHWIWNLSLQSMKTRLRATVGESYWEASLKGYLTHFQTKMLERKKATVTMAGGSSATTTKSASSSSQVPIHGQPQSSSLSSQQQQQQQQQQARNLKRPSRHAMQKQLAERQLNERRARRTHGRAGTAQEGSRTKRKAAAEEAGAQTETTSS